MSQEQFFAQSLDAAITEARDIVTAAKAEYGPVKTFALFSGGNDSTVLLDLAFRNGEPLADAALHIDTGIGIPETNEWARRVCADWGIPLTELTTPPETYEWLVMRFGFPGPSMHRVAYSRLKERRLDDLTALKAGHRRRGERLLFLTGARAYESVRRMGTATPHKLDPRKPEALAWSNPIVYFDARLMNEYRTRYDLPRNPVADTLHMSGECLCGAFAHPGEREELALWFPETWARIEALEAKAAAAGLRACRWGMTKGAVPSEPQGELCSSCTARLFDDESLPLVSLEDR